MKTFNNPSEFRTSLETRLNNLSKASNEDPQRIRRRVAFDRFLSRIFSLDKAKERFFLKGGYAMELRFNTARATKDIDLTYLKEGGDSWKSKDQEIAEILREAALLNLGDYFEYRVSQETEEIGGAPYGGARFKIDSLVDKRLFVRFQLDVGSDILVERAESIQGEDWLAFMGVDRPEFRMISVEQQFAEKLHAYSLPRGNRGNSRVRDLVDLWLLSENRPIDLAKLSKTILAVFTARGTHSIPMKLVAPPKDWESPFKKLSQECGLNVGVSEAFERAASIFYGTMN
jgi:predicted nucleotidyltransferase component of viral defense system